MLNPNEALKALKSHAKPAWRPQCRPEQDGESHASKFAGYALLNHDENWPECPQCQSPLKLFLQLDCQSLPEGVEKYFAGLKRLRQSQNWIQLFYCLGKGGWLNHCDDWKPFSDTHLVRVLRAEDKPQLSTQNLGWPGQSITGWEALQDLPHYEDYQKLDVPSEIQAALAEAEIFEALGEPGPAEKDKLGGWPYWVQSSAAPACSACGKIMDVIFQIDSEDHLPHMFGDGGMGHLSQCPEHPEVLAFGWACY